MVAITIRSFFNDRYKHLSESLRKLLNCENIELNRLKKTLHFYKINWIKTVDNHFKTTICS